MFSLRLVSGEEVRGSENEIEPCSFVFLKLWDKTLPVPLQCGGKDDGKKHKYSSGKEQFSVYSNKVSEREIIKAANLCVL